LSEALYDELAEWWPVMSPPDDYVEEAGHFARLLDELGPHERVLELGAGGGHNAVHLKSRYALTLVDRSAAMLAQSRKLNPECHHVVGDMREVRLATRFDAVFIHDAIDYLLTPLDLAVTLANARAHCRDGGAVLLVPDHFAETFEPGVEDGGHERDGRSLRYFSWSHAPKPGETTYVTDYVLMLREGDDPVRVVHDVHRCGLFDRETWLTTCREAGLEPEIRVVELTDPDPLTVEALLCRAV
jgi:SAM-dependent methyltransferase